MIFLKIVIKQLKQILNTQSLPLNKWYIIVLEIRKRLMKVIKIFNSFLGKKLPLKMYIIVFQTGSQHKLQ